MSSSHVSDTNPLGIQGIHHIELYVGNSKQAGHYYSSMFGLIPIAQSGPETGCQEHSSRDRKSVV